MKIARFEPFPYVDFLNRSTAGNPGKQTNAEWQPAVDVLEDKGRFLLRADVPGVSPGDIDVSMDAGVLTISGARISEKNDDATDSQRIERSTGRFLRRFTLPESANAEGITATTHNGILEVVIPKQPEVEARRITVEAA